MKMKIQTKNLDVGNEEKRRRKEKENENSNKNEIDHLLYKECVLPLTDMILSNLADIFNVNRDTDSMIDPQLCLFIRTVLGL